MYWHATRLFLVAWCFFPFTTEAAIVINEIAWPHTNFVIVLIGMFILSEFIFVRTKGSQSWCWGKMGVIALLFFIPYTSNAAVVINEVAWMGTETSANDEWIELYNTDSSSVNVDGWTLSDSMNLNIDLVGTIDGYEYVMLERTDDDSAPGRAFLIYTGAIGNTGATLTLKRSNGSTEDQVAGGDNWEQIGGDNVTKETAQLTEDGWHTAAATPGQPNATFESDDKQTTKQSSQTTTSQFTTGRVVPQRELTAAEAALVLDIDGPNIAYVHQPVSFSAKPSGLGSVLIDSLQYSWNLGDTATKTGRVIRHTYDYPGEYVVVVKGSYARHAAVARVTVTVLPVRFSVTRSERGDIQIHNDAKYETDLSGYRVVGSRVFMVPDQTWLLPGATLTIPKEKLGVTPAVYLFDASHQLAASDTRPDSALVDAPFPAAVLTVPPTDYQAATAPDSDFRFVKKENNSTATIVAQTPLATSTATNTTTPTTSRLAYVSLIGVIALALAGLYGRQLV